MYFLNQEERLYLNKSLIPQSRNMYIDEDLRGWNWQRPPLEPIYDMKLGVFEVANNYCFTNRDLFLRRVLEVRPDPNKAMIEGMVLHKTIMHFVTETKKILYSMDIKGDMDFKFLDLKDQVMREIIKKDESTILEGKIERLWDFEKQKVTFRLQEVLSRQPYIGIDALLYQVLPVVVEHKLNGSFLGLSSHLSTDALNFSEPMIVDIKFGEKREFHKLSVTGYALVMEAIYSFPVNLGFVVYPKFKGNRILIERDIFIIDDELRQKFIEIRDEKMRMIYQEDDPGKHENCYKSCPFYGKCS
ncbi:MAG: type I-A CRISPR-associated protein Cas4/Csa1 [Halanaerobiales bacterium]